MITVGAEAAGVGRGATGEREGGLPSACSAVGILGVAKKGVGSVERKVRRGSRHGKCYLTKQTAAASAFSVVNEEEDKDVEK